MERDLRDPTALGDALLRAVLIQNLGRPEARKAYTATETYDSRNFIESVPDYDGSNDIVTVTPAGAKH